ncbi:saccharopine dehydrogenase family protein [Noviherbaspirillum aerium]|uniref:saccharopine dehydrogenase family protein n=1 Tax=Noviherbaspirillum aerium TaxID=2588497 RepID=UPI00124EA629|nr:saccharopine dehydrogenase NADP-binding domain-containing protein [Noviherbaspirillum aerium]
MKTIVLGGYGNVGARISRALAQRPVFELVVAGRDAQRAARLAGELPVGASHAHLDAGDPDLGQRLKALGAQLVIHAAGPFQPQGYGAALAAAAAGAHYIDLAHGRRFVCDFAASTGAAFRQANTMAITGAGAVPALSSAVIDALSAGWQQVRSIDLCIAPGQTAPRGAATLAAVLDDCGAPIQVWEQGQWRTRHGWAEPERVDFHRLPPRLGALCDISDLELLPQRYPGVRSVMFRAALEIGAAQWMLAAMSGLRRAGLLKSPARLAGLLHRAGKCLDRFGTALGGMVVRVEGVNAAGRLARHAWHITVGDNHGAELPCMPAILLAERIAGGTLSAPGAHAAMGWLSLPDFTPEFERWGMTTHIVHERSGDGA